MDLTEFNIEAGVDSSSGGERIKPGRYNLCLLYTSDAADEP